MGDSPLVTVHGLWLNGSMVSFSERHGCKPARSRLHQLEGMDDRLRNAIWNFLLERFFVKEERLWSVRAGRKGMDRSGGRSF